MSALLVGVPREARSGETRVAATPTSVEQLIKLGYQVVVEAGAGLGADIADDAYTAAGAGVASREQAWGADIVVKVNAPDDDEITLLRDGATLIGLLAPALNPDLVGALSR